MKILILHRIPYYKIEYHRGINHDLHDVTYIGLQDLISDLPESIRCTKIVRPGKKDCVSEVLDLVADNSSFDRIISLSEYELMDAAILRSKLSVPGPLPEEVELVRDKVKMKKAVSDSDIKTAICLRADTSFSDLKELFSNKKIVLKPVDGASSQDVFIFENISDALIKSSELKENGRDLSKFQFENFINGTVFHMDGLVLNGEIQCFVASQYVGTCYDYAKGKPLGSFQLEYDERYEDWAQKCIDAVKIKNSAFHLEAILYENDFYFLEIGARVGGADVVDSFEMATGIHLPSEELNIILNSDTKIKSNVSFENLYGWFVFPGHLLGDTFKGFHGFEEFISNPSLLRWDQLSVGAFLNPSITYQSKDVPLSGLVRGRNSNELKNLIENIFRKVN